LCAGEEVGLQHSGADSEDCTQCSCIPHHCHSLWSSIHTVLSFLPDWI